MVFLPLNRTFYHPIAAARAFHRDSTPINNRKAVVMPEKFAPQSSNRIHRMFSSSTLRSVMAHLLLPLPRFLHRPTLADA